MKANLVILILLILSCSLKAQIKKKHRNSKNIQINSLIDYQSAAAELRMTFSVERLLGSKLPDGIAIQLTIKKLSTQKVVLDSTFSNLGKLDKINEHFIFYHTLPQSTERFYLLATVVDQIRQEQKSLDIYVIPPIKTVDFSWENLTEAERHLPKSTDSIVFKSVKDQTLWVYHFKPNFFPAAPPMQRKVASGRKSMEVDSLFSIQVNQPFQLSREGLYFAQADTTGNAGLGIRVTPPDYPSFSRVDHVANSLIYITTSEDIKKMLATDDQKAALDEFWLEMGGSEVNARRLIKAYYQRVAYANAHLSSHKLGWKTDKGMIYIVFGPPHEIINGEDYEIWRYFNQKPGNQRVDFEFIHKPGLFSHNHYQLRRGNHLRGFWYNKVKEWRKGSVLTFE